DEILAARGAAGSRFGIGIGKNAGRKRTGGQQHRAGFGSPRSVHGAHGTGAQAEGVSRVTGIRRASGHGKRRLGGLGCRLGNLLGNDGTTCGHSVSRAMWRESSTHA
ncbi:MAG TPA: hypothetical protein VF573_16520, partial [Paraburkholderia sp.]|uniref:hypothetical protein n=1 Tax=Paraburkholderia sp. TaxID=1926495 RepID=UPI002ED5C1FA